MKIAVITPYFRENPEVLLKNIKSIQSQTVRCDHIMIAEGYAQSWISNEKNVRHIILDKPHSDFGNTPRAIGGMLAISEGYDAIAMLDADNWYDTTHIETCIETAKSSNLGIDNLDYVIGKRRFVSPDGEDLSIDEEPNHIDTNCFFYLKGSFFLIPQWGLYPNKMSHMGDRLFYNVLKKHNLTYAVNDFITVNYTTIYKIHYQITNKPMPADAKDGVDLDAISFWINSLSSRERSILDKLCGINIKVSQ